MSKQIVRARQPTYTLQQSLYVVSRLGIFFSALKNFEFFLPQVHTHLDNVKGVFYYDNEMSTDGKLHVYILHLCTCRYYIFSKPLKHDFYIKYRGAPGMIHQRIRRELSYNYYHPN
jgi:hypothetical protein